MRRLVQSRNEINKVILLILTVALPGSTVATAQQASNLLHDPTTKSARQVVVSIPDRKLALVEDGRTLKVYAVAVGAPESPSPEGEFKVITRIENPTFYKPGTVIEPGKDNPLGTRWIGINRKGYGIHGTNVPASIGKAASHGCIRMNQGDLEELFAVLRPGDVVHIRAERDEEVARVMAPEPVDTQSVEASEMAAAFAAKEDASPSTRVGPDFASDFTTGDSPSRPDRF
jgi:hypothetical protein